jgi:hypothetical protein
VVLRILAQFGTEVGGDYHHSSYTHLEVKRRDRRNDGTFYLPGHRTLSGESGYG